MSDHIYGYALAVVAVLGFVLGEIYQARRHGYDHLRKLLRDRLALIGGIVAALGVLGFGVSTGHVVDSIAPTILAGALVTAVIAWTRNLRQRHR